MAGDTRWAIFPFSVGAGCRPGSAALVEMYVGLALAAPRRSVARSTVGAGDRLSRVPVTDSGTHCRLIATKQTNYTF